MMNSPYAAAVKLQIVQIRVLVVPMFSSMFAVRIAVQHLSAMWPRLA